jgi:hypothetical protein
MGTWLLRVHKSCLYCEQIDRLVDYPQAIGASSVKCLYTNTIQYTHLSEVGS